MHIEPGIVDGTKMVLSYATAAASMGYLGKLAVANIREQGLPSFVQRALITSLAVFSFFEVFPHYPVGVSEVHFILGSTLFLLFGAAAAGVGLVLGLATQSVFFAPQDLPQYGMNVTTLLVPLFGIEMLARRLIAPGTAYVEISYRQALALSTAFQAGIVGWVIFWVLYGSGFSVETFAGLAKFGGAYMSVILAEPLVDLALLAAAKFAHGLSRTGFVVNRLYNRA
ncbi:MAG: energy-coupling factor ABC transporter permease [Hyphomicrobiales bacterium]|uniref:energy-coupling factor ABC transporter permease n=1 Tax=Rhabdaerophilum calidifontis TaxID=2604328 RepID=UPI00123BFD83|nr:energy-coupling factor ABC transporter permease [Rhabdaerophilum calidifontis]MCA1951521.1 energy-coupling factor ABC transporter permease [Hyphomicrobiales bacterium]MCA1998289.1 energy-coupling factor ABC transporter permease [Hyphomicrobiales bacterium]